MEKEFLLRDIILNINELFQDGFEKKPVLDLVKKIKAVDILPPVFDITFAFVQESVEIVSMKKRVIILTEEGKEKIKIHKKELRKTFNGIRNLLSGKLDELISENFRNLCSVV